MSSYSNNPTIRDTIEAWIAPIFDRTISDIENKTTKAYLNSEDINRIESNIYNLSEAFNLKLVCKLWNKDNIPTKENMERIRSNVDKLLLKIGEDTSISLNSKPNYEDINKLELAINKAHDYLLSKQNIQIQAGYYCANEPLHLMAERNN